MNKSVAIIGNGWVARGMQELFTDSVTYVRDYSKAIETDPDCPAGKYSESKEYINKRDVAFICVPTPNYEKLHAVQDGEGALNTSIVEECIAWCECPLIVIRSTVNPGDCDRWAKMYNKRIVMMPEYLGETPAHPLLDTKQTNFLILGGDKKDTRQLINLFTTVYNANTNIRQVTTLEAEIIKLSENRAIAFKVAQCQELYDVCEKAGVDYYTIRDAVYGDDPRFNLWFTLIYPDNRGFHSSKCLKKDVPAWCAWAESLGYNPEITRTLFNKSKEYAKDKTD